MRATTSRRAAGRGPVTLPFPPWGREGRVKGGGRRGAVSLYFLLAAPVFLVLLVVTLRGGTLRHRQLELQIAVDAAALAGANALVDDVLLAETTATEAMSLAEARTGTQRYAAANRVQGRPL